MSQANEIVGGPAHRRDNHAHVPALGRCCSYAIGYPLELGNVCNRAASVLLNHCVWHEA
jgi:hypothetical protein